jgi:hypothetical protein
MTAVYRKTKKVQATNLVGEAFRYEYAFGIKQSFGYDEI